MDRKRPDPSAEIQFEYVAVDLSSSLKVVRIIPTCDAHYGNLYFSEKHFNEQIDYILNVPEAYTVLNGDLVECVTRFSKGDIHKKIGTAGDQRDYMIEKLMPIKHKILAVTQGNHEARIEDVDVSKDIAKALGVYYRAEGAMVKISFGGGNSGHPEKPYVYWGYCTHGHGGARTKSSKAVKVERLAAWLHADFYCLHPQTKVLKGNLTWVELGEIKVGDELIGVSEYPEFNQTRQVKHTVVTDVKYRKAETLWIQTESGRNIHTTSDHLWLNKRRHDWAKLGGRYNWYRADALAKGDELLQVFPVWETPDDWVTGYIAGLLDGEGSITVGNRRERVLVFTQKEGLVMSYFEDYLALKHIDYRKYKREDGCSQLVITRDAAILLGTTKPIRLDEKARQLIEKRLHKPEIDKIAYIGKGGYHDVVTIETDAHTFIAEGLATHNCMSHDHVVNIAPDVYLIPDPRTHTNKDGFKVGWVKAHRKMLIKAGAFLKWGGYAERGGFPPSDLTNPVIKLDGEGKKRVRVEV
uniref:Hint domain-containing protein n=1 Tax=viral metagenome TaxID=1070528 RepID=A0A6M3LJ42_9ZZZZ